MKRTILTAILSLLAICMNAQEQRKTISILGDSYSTFVGFIPKGNAIWYDLPVNPRNTDVSDVRQTWWWKTISEGGYKLGVNDSYSGATISYSGYDDADYSDRSFITRAERLGDLGNPDIILIFGGTNDSWAGTKVGNYVYEDFRKGDLYFYRPALAKLLQTLQEHYPNVELYFLLNSELRDDINESTKTICRHYSVPCIELKDIDKMAGHPSIKGMSSISKQVLSVLDGKKKK